VPVVIEVCPNPEAAAEAAALRFIGAAGLAMRARGRFVVALSGGHTPQRLYELLATPRFASEVEWARVQVCWGDERCVPPDHQESNFRMARVALLDRVPIPDANLHRIRGECAPAAEARRYEKELQELLDAPGSQLDLVLLGLGADGHTASLFPGATSVHNSRRWVEPAAREGDDLRRVTLTPCLINTASQVLFLVSGGAKAEVVRRVLEGPADPHTIPAQLIAPTDGDVVWILDREAGSGVAANW
jgi:6-phosphogluconolactonase